MSGKKHRALALIQPRCQPCGDTGVVQLVEHWTGLNIAPAVVTCPHCCWPWLPVQTYYFRKSVAS